MKLKKLAILFAAAACLQTATAIPADPRPKLVKQPDGSTLTVIMRGDERHHMTMTADGVPLYYNTASKTFEYASLADGRIRGSGIAAADAGKRDAQALEYVQNMDTQAMKQAAMNAGGPMKAPSGPNRIRINDFPSLGKQKSLVVLWEFSDVKFESVSAPKQFYTDMLNKEGFTYSNGANGSARDFYLASSFGRFDPEFVVVGPVTLSGEATYYGSDAGGQDAMIYEAIIESCKALDDEIDFAEFDNDGDGVVDNIYFYYAGNGQADTPNGTNYIWPHSYYLEGGYGQELILDGKKIDRYTCSNELRFEYDGSLIPTGIGTFVHEFGHVLGLADHYDTSYNIFGTDPGIWDTMASGSYNDNMNTPPLFSAFERAELGWLEYTELDSKTDTISKLPMLAESNMAYRVKVEGNDNEYFIMENRQQRGWDKTLPGHGMLVWHIDMDEDAWNGNYVNADPTHPRVDIVEADGSAFEVTMAGDPFPGSKNVTEAELTAWNGTTAVKLADVNEQGDTIRLLLGGTTYKMQAPDEITITETRDSSFTFSWSKVADARYYKVSVMQPGADGEYTFLSGYDGLTLNEVDTLAIENLVPETRYKIEVIAGISDYTSEAVTAEVETLPLVFEKKQPQGLTASDITQTGFTAAWEEMDDADDYRVTLYHHTYSTETTAQGYDFSDKYNGMPLMWTTSSDIYYSVNGYYGEKSPSLRLSGNGDYLTIAYAETLIDKVTFWCRASASGSKLKVETLKGDEWVETETVEIPKTATTLSINTDGAEAVRLTLERESGYVAIDDVVADCRKMIRQPVEEYDNISTGGKMSITFGGLTGGQAYSFRVRGVSNGTQSYLSEECAVHLPEGTGIALETVEGLPAEAIYDLQGRRMTSDNLPDGIYIIVKGGKATKQVVRQR